MAIRSYTFNIDCHLIPSKFIRTNILPFSYAPNTLAPSFYGQGDKAAAFSMCVGGLVATIIVDNMRSIVRKVEFVAECLLAYPNESQTYIHRGFTYLENICLVENRHVFF
ncbi:hypothetical protein HMPREF1640_09810 [Prevotella sp. S7-1-8]|nr:hypothetical protein HMPREF1640_09810 [Prevotella sp. S7-1-8]